MTVNLETLRALGVDQAVLDEVDQTLRTAPAADKPCALYRYHAPAVVVTEGHHRHPVYLQNRLYGQIRDPELLYLCSNCHEAVHSWIYWLLGERRKPNPEPGRLAKEEAEATVAWYRAAQPSTA